MSELELPESTVAVINEGNTAIVVDDHCYCLRNWNPEAKKWGFSAWIFKEASAKLRELPVDPDDARIIGGPGWPNGTPWSLISDSPNPEDVKAYEAAHEARNMMIKKRGSAKA